MTRKILHNSILKILILSMILSCGEEADDVLSIDIFQTSSSTIEGTTLMQASLAYPIDGSTGVPIDADIVIVFTKTVDHNTVASATGNVTITGSVSGAITYTDPAADGRVITLAPTSSFSPLETITVTLNTGVTATTGEALEQDYAWTFTAGNDTSSSQHPRVISGTQSPTGAGVNINTQYIEVTFSKAVDVATVTTGTFTIAPAVGGSSISQVGGTNTFRLDLGAALIYSTVYTIDLTNVITDPPADGSNPLVEDGEDTWAFTTEADPGGGALQIDSVWAESVNVNSAYIYFTTNFPVDIATTDCRVRYGTTTGVYTTVTAAEGNWDGGGTDHILHRIQLSGLSASTTYYLRTFIDSDGGADYDAGEPDSSEINFTTRKVISNSANNQDDIFILQSSGGGGYVFWVSNQSGNDDIYGQFLTAPALCNGHRR